MSITGLDLSKTLGETKLLGGVVITDEWMGGSQLLGARARASPSLRLWCLWFRVTITSGALLRKLCSLCFWHIDYWLNLIAWRWKRTQAEKGN